MDVQAEGLRAMLASREHRLMKMPRTLCDADKDPGQQYYVA
jgi:hypothetical protein